MLNRFAVAAALAATFLLTACGPDAAGDPGAATHSPGVAPSTSATTAAPAGMTPADVCALVTLAEVAHATSITMTATETSTSGDVAVCKYIGHGADGYTAAKMFLEYQPTGKAAIEFTKAHAVAVEGLGAPAYYFDTAGQLSVELAGTASFTVYVADVRVHHGDPKAAAAEVAGIAVPKLLHG